MLQLIAARRIAPEPEVEASLLGGLLHLRALRKLIQFDAPLSAIVSSPDGSYIVSADRSHHLVGGSIDTGNNLRFWDAKSGRPIGAPLGHKSPVDAIAFSPDGSLRLWDARNGQPIDASIGNAGGAVYSAAFNPDGTRIVSGGCGILAGSRDRNDHLRLWDPQTGKPIGERLEGHLQTLHGVAFSSDGITIASGSSDSTLRFWDA
jgi:WD40 repeat protein